MSIYLEKDTANRISVDATQTVTISPVFYFFVFDNVQENLEFKTYLDRDNAGNERFGQFTLTLPTDLDMPSGSYRYRIFENANNTDTDETAMNQLETGIAKVLGTTQEITAYEATETQIYVYAES